MKFKTILMGSKEMRKCVLGGVSAIAEILKPPKAQQ